MTEVAPNKSREGWPGHWGWETSWIYLINRQVLIMEDITRGHGGLLESWIDDSRIDIDPMTEPMHLGLILTQTNDDGNKEYVIYPEYSDWDQGLEDLPIASDSILKEVKDRAESFGWSPVIGVLTLESEIISISKVKESFNSYEYDPSILISRSGISKIAAGSIIKFVSTPNKFLVGEDTHHIYLLEAEYGVGEFPSDTGAIGRAWLENDMITGIGFDFGGQSGQQLAINQLKKWADHEGYGVSPDLDLDIRGLASMS